MLCKFIVEVVDLTYDHFIFRILNINYNQYLFSTNYQ